MSHKSGKKVVIIALLSNLGIAIFKLIAASVSGSSSMLAEAYHSLSDTVNQVILLKGLRASQKPADRLHPFGYGREQYFWAFIVSMLIFFVAGALSVREGIHKFQYPVELEKIGLSLISLVVAFFFESSAFIVAFKELRQTMREEELSSYWEAIRQSKDPTVLAVLFEDSLAMIGLLIAFTAIVSSYYLKIPIIDAIASLIIGLLLMFFAFVLASENKELLIGEAVTPFRRKRILEAINSITEVKEIIDLKTLHLSPQKVLIAAELNFDDALITDEVEMVIDKVEQAIYKIVPDALCYIEAQS